MPDDKKNTRIEAFRAGRHTDSAGAANGLLTVEVGQVHDDAVRFVRAGAPRFHNGGVIGSGEVPAILRRGEGVFTREQMHTLGGPSQLTS